MPKAKWKTAMRPFFQYFGGKWRIALKYPPPRYNTIIEPFAGAAGYSTHWWNREVILHDVNEKVYGVWSYLLKVLPGEILRLPTNIMCLDELPTTIPQEAKWLIGWWFGVGLEGPRKQRSAWYKLHPDNNWGPTVRHRIARQVSKIRHWKIFNKSYAGMDYNREATWYIDPPYKVSGRAYPNRDIDYVHLGNWVRERKGQVICCEEDGADWLPFKPFLRSQSQSRSGVCKEVIYLQ